LILTEGERKPQMKHRSNTDQTPIRIEEISALQTLNFSASRADFMVVYSFTNIMLRCATAFGSEITMARSRG
jgi:hypothetical protein